MPTTRIDTRKGWIGPRRTQLLEALHRAIAAAVNVPVHDRCMILAEHEADAFLVPATAGPGYMVVSIALFPGRTLEIKRTLYRAICDALAPFGVAPADIRTILYEVPREDWGQDGVPASEAAAAGTR